MDAYNHFKLNKINKVLTTKENETSMQIIQLLNQSFVAFINVIKI
jgi:hypothetical protein